jgi:hypothetical protein
MAQSENTSNALIPLLPGSTRGQAVPFSKRIENSDDAPYDNSIPNDPRPRTIIFTGNPHINASVEDRLTSYDQTEIFKFHPVDIIILGAFNRTQIQNRPSYLNALLIQSRGIDAETVS